MKLIETIVGIVFLFSFIVILMSFVVFMKKDDQTSMERFLYLVEYNNFCYEFYYYPESFIDILENQYEKIDKHDEYFQIEVDYRKIKIYYHIYYSFQEGNECDVYKMNIEAYDENNNLLYFPYEAGEKVARKFK